MQVASRRNPRSFRSARRWPAWLVLIALLFIHIKVAVGGCLVAGALADATHDALQVGALPDGPNPCSNPGTPTEKACLKHCAQSADTPKPTSDLLAFGPIGWLPVRAVFVAQSPETNLFPPDSRIASAGPPAYLRFLRLLN